MYAFFSNVLMFYTLQRRIKNNLTIFEKKKELPEVFLFLDYGKLLNKFHSFVLFRHCAIFFTNKQQTPYLLILDHAMHYKNNKMYHLTFFF